MIANFIGFGGPIGVTFGLFFYHLYAVDFVRDQYSERTPDAPKITFGDWASGEKIKVYPASPDVLKLASLNMQRVGLTEELSDKIEVFTSALLDPVVTGSTFSNEGAAVGLPRHLVARTTEELDLSTIRIKPYWNRYFPGYVLPTEGVDQRDLEELKESMVLSPEALSFVVAKCLQKAQDYSTIVQTFLPGSMMLLHYIFGVKLNEDLGLMKRPRPLRLAIQSLWLVTVVLLTCAMHSEVRRYFEQKAIRSVVRTPAEKRGAVEFFSKSLARNQLLRRILGPESEYYFTEEGEVVAEFYEFPENVSWRGFRDYCESLVVDSTGGDELPDSNS